MNNDHLTIEDLELCLSSDLLKRIASFGYANRHLEDVDALRGAYRALLTAIVAEKGDDDE